VGFERLTQMNVAQRHAPAAALHQLRARATATPIGLRMKRSSTTPAGCAIDIAGNGGKMAM